MIGCAYKEFSDFNSYLFQAFSNSLILTVLKCVKHLIERYVYKPWNFIHLLGSPHPARTSMYLWQIVFFSAVMRDLPVQTEEVENIWQLKMRTVTHGTRTDCHYSICDTTGDRRSRQGWQFLRQFILNIRDAWHRAICRFLQLK